MNPVIEVVQTHGATIEVAQTQRPVIEVNLTATGPAGPGVPDGGTTGQVLAKLSDDDQDTDWIDASGTGTVTSVAVAVPTGLEVAGGPITTSGTITLSYSTGYALPTIAAVAQGVTAYGYGNHATAGYLTSSAAALAYQPLAAVLTETTASFTTADETKLDHISVTQAVDLDAIETRVNGLDAAVVIKGIWDASAGTFPGSGTAQAGESWIVSVAGTVDSVAFLVGDRVIAITDNASTTVFAANWFHEDYTDKVSSVAGRVGAVTIASTDITDSTTAGRAILTAADAAAQRTAMGVTSVDLASPGTIGGTTPGVVNATKVAIAAGTHTTNSERTESVTATWNGSGQTMVAREVNITNTASATGSKFESWKLNTLEMVRITKEGGIWITGSFSNSGSIIESGTGLTLKCGAGGVALMAGSDILTWSSGVLKRSSNGTGLIIGGATKAADQSLSPNGLVGDHAQPTATTNIVGGIVNLAGGDGASSSSGAAHGGALTVDGGRGYGTGAHGDVKVGETRGKLRVYQEAFFSKVIDLPHYTNATEPAFFNGGWFFNDDLDKARVGGAAAWETVTSI